MTAISLDSTRLEALLESAQLLNSSLDLDSLLQHLLRTVMGRLLVGRGFVAVENDGAMTLAQIRGLKGFKVGDSFDEKALRKAGIHFIYPIGKPEQPIGFLGIGKPPNDSVAPEEEESLKALLSLAASSIANARAHDQTRRFNQELNEKIQELRALLDLVRGLTSTLEPEEVARLLVLTLSGRWGVGKYALVVQKQGHPVVLRQKGIAVPPLEEIQSFIAELPEAVLVENLPDSDFKVTLISQKAVLLFPLRSSESTSGILVFGSRLGKQLYTEADLEFGAGLVAQAGVAFENSWYVRETIERKKLEQELALAASIQEGLFPEILPVLPNFELAARNRPALQCGGDYYDVLPIISTENGDGKSFLLCVADVSGKGLPASLLMSNMQATLRALLGRVPTLVELAARTNELLYATTPSNKFVTAILLEVEPGSGIVKYVNAGHGDCMLLRNASGETERLESTGLPLGMMASDLLEMLGKNYEERELKLNSGDLLALYSDGVTEAYDEAENEWGDERLLKCLRSVEKEPVQTIISRVFEEIDCFAGAAPQHDDITLMILKRGDIIS
ncbi:MAG TPA: SpoIIE family protein phosphatase [Pyrinomonadaceae bacterium]|jgi:sigma-B regulation protein RsbU (phosphoserine phosphatase)